MEWNGLQVPRFDKAARRLTGIRQAGVLGALAGELLVNYNVPSTAVDRGTFGLADYVGAQQDGGPVAAENSHFTIRNIYPDAIITARMVIHVWPAGGMRLFLSNGAPVAGAPWFANFTDSRINMQGPTGVVGTTPVVPPTGQVYTQVPVPSQLPYTLPELVLLPGFSAVAIAVAVNLVMSGHAEGTVRSCDSSEFGPFGI